MNYSRIFYSLTLTCAVFLALGCGKEKDKTDSTISPPPPAAAPQPGRDISALSHAPDRKSLNGTAVEYTRVPVQAVVGNFVFWAGPNGEQMPIVRGDKISGPVLEHVKVGDQVNITGNIRSFESLAPGDPYLKMWDHTITNAERTQIEAAGVFVAADKVTVVHVLP